MMPYIFFILMQPISAADVEVERQIIYQKETSIDLTGSKVEGETQVPPTFFVMKMNTQKGQSLLEERLQFGLRDYNELGF